jgi:signal transduction histidine kinase
MKLFFQKRRVGFSGGSSSPEKASFVRHITHDINGDFYGVASLCFLLKRAIEKKEDPIPLLDHLTGACRDYNTKLGNFIQYTRSDAGIAETFKEPLNIRELLRKMIAEYESLMEEKMLSIDLLISEKVPAQILSDEFKISQVVANLLVNAISFSPHGVPIVLQIDIKNNWLVIIVKDKGEGMTADQLDCIFDPSPSSRKKLKNPMGLGLLVSRYLVEDVLKGKLSLASQENIGTEVNVLLPLN